MKRNANGIINTISILDRIKRRYLFDDALQFYTVNHGRIVDLPPTNATAVFVAGQFLAEDFQALFQPGYLVFPVFDLLLELCLSLPDP